jgi:hypothetical protein
LVISRHFFLFPAAPCDVLAGNSFQLWKQLWDNVGDWVLTLTPAAVPSAGIYDI